MMSKRGIRELARWMYNCDPVSRKKWKRRWDAYKNGNKKVIFAHFEDFDLYLTEKEKQLVFLAILDFALY